MTVYAVIAALLMPALLQAVSLPDQPMPSGLSTAERGRLQREQKIDSRIRIYAAASDERRRAVLKAMAERNSEVVSTTLQSWTELLDYSLEDIRTKAGRHSKSKALRSYEIHLRRSLGSVNDLKAQGTYKQLEEFDTWLKHAEAVRSIIVRILFPN